MSTNSAYIKLYWRGQLQEFIKPIDISWTFCSSAEASTWNALIKKDFVNHKLLPMMYVEIVVDNTVRFTGSLEDINPYYDQQQRIEIGGYGIDFELTNRMVKWGYNDYIHNIVRDLLNRYNSDGYITIDTYETGTASFANGSPTVTLAGGDWSAFDGKWIELPYAAGPPATTKWYKVSTIDNATTITLTGNYDGSETTGAFVLDDLDVDDYTTVSGAEGAIILGKIQMRFINDSIAACLEKLSTLSTSMFWIDWNNKLHFHLQDIGAESADYVYFKDFNVQNMTIRETSRDTKNRGLLFGGNVAEPFVVTSADATTITDSTKDWATDQFKGYSILVESGVDVGLVYHIQSNSATVLTLGAHNIVTTDVVTVKGRVFEYIQDNESIFNSKFVREFVLNDETIMNPWYARFLLIKEMDKYAGSQKQGSVEFPLGNILFQPGEVVDLRGFANIGTDTWDNMLWDFDPATGEYGHWVADDIEEEVFKFYLTRFTHKIDENGLTTQVEINENLPHIEDVIRDVEERVRAKEQEGEDVEAFYTLSDAIPVMWDSKPVYPLNTAIGSTFEQGLQITYSGAVQVWY
jgi:hypothetical protein